MEKILHIQSLFGDYMKSEFCYRCGKTNVPLHDSICQECYWKDHYAAQLKFSELELNLCKHCGAVMLPNGWSKSNSAATLPDFLAGIAPSWVKTSIDNMVTATPVIQPHWEMAKPQLDLEIEVIDESISEFSPHSEYHMLIIQFLWSICPACAKRETGGDIIFQLRAVKRALLPAEIDFVEATFRNIITQVSEEDNLAFVSDVIARHQGYDFKVGSKAVVDAVIEILKKKWTAHIETNYSLVGEERDGTRKYSITYLYKLPGVVHGDYVNYQGKLCIVSHFNQAAVILVDILNLESIIVRDWLQLIPTDPLPFNVHYLVVSQDYNTDTYEFMDLQDYHTFEVAKNRFPQPLPIGGEVDLYLWQDELYLPFTGDVSI